MTMRNASGGGAVGLLEKLLLLFLPLASVAQQQQQLPTPYTLWTAQEITETLQQWSSTYSDFVKVKTSQQEFGLPAAGTFLDCPFEGGNVNGCLNYYAVVQDYVAHPEGSVSSQHLPTMLLSGELHGNERVGPTSVLEATRVLLEAAACEALPRYTDDNDVQWEQESAEALSCRTTLQEKYGMSDAQRRWLARLVSTRRILLVPTANALGYYRNTREEGFVDPNRDFPYDHLPYDTDKCMQTIAARTMNELFRHYLISNSFTFHGGTELLGYEWGNPTHYGSVSPDDVAQDQLARSYSAYGGNFVGNNGRAHPDYLYGDMNSIIYYVRGGFEDFAYAGSWDTANMVVCQPTSYGGYPAEKTTYDGGMLRSFNMLVETSWSKTPNEKDLGTSWNVLYENSINENDSNQRRRQRQLLRTRQLTLFGGGGERQAQGHIPRNLRLSIAAIEMIQPYLRTTAVNGVALADNDIVPLSPRGYPDHPACNNRALVTDTKQRLLTQAVGTGALPIVDAPLSSSGGITLDWTVGGAMTIEQTQLWVAALDDSSIAALDGADWLQNYICGDPADEDMSLSQRLDPTSIRGSFTAVGTAQAGTGFFSPYGAQPAPPAGDDTMGPVFTSTLDLTSLNVNSETVLVVLASANVDSSWTELPVNTAVAPNTGPQSHMVQARTNPNWYFENKQGYIIQGQVEFFSAPILVRLVDDSSSTTTLVNDRLQKPSERPSLGSAGSASESGNIAIGNVFVQAEEASTVVPTETISPTLDGSAEATTTMSPETAMPSEELPSEELVLTVVEKLPKPEPQSHQSLADARRNDNKLSQNPDGPDRQRRQREERTSQQQKHLVKRGRSRAVRGQHKLLERP